VLGINQRYFSLKKDSVEMFSAYMQEVNLKIYHFKFILLTLLSFGPHVCIGNSSFMICGVCLVVVASETSSYYTHHTSTLPVCFFSRRGIENFYMVLPYPVKERVTKTEIFQWLSKNA